MARIFKVQAQPGRHTPGRRRASILADRAMDAHLFADTQDSIDREGRILRAFSTRRQHQNLGQVVLQSGHFEADGLAAVTKGNGAFGFVFREDFIFRFFGNDLFSL